MIKQKTGTFIVHIPYRGIPQAVMAVVSNEVPMTWSGIPSARAHLASGKIRALAYGGKTRSSASQPWEPHPKPSHNARRYHLPAPCLHRTRASLTFRPTRRARATSSSPAP
jgi:hypothetical protein